MLCNHSSSVTPFSSCPQSFPASGSLPMSQLFASGGQSVGASASASVPSYEYSGLISFRVDWFDLLEVQGTLKVLLQHHNLKASVLWRSNLFMAQLFLDTYLSSRVRYIHEDYFKLKITESTDAERVLCLPSSAQCRA